MIPWTLLLPALLIGWVAGRVPYRVRARKWRQLREEYLAEKFAENLSKVAELSWAYVKDNAPYVHRYFRAGDHRKVARSRLAFWWEQTKPRYGNIMWKV